MSKYAIGLDYGTNSVRALIVDVATGEEIATSVWDYAHGEAGIVLDPRDPQLARQHPKDYADGAEICVQAAIAVAAGHGEFNAADVIGIGVDTTGSTPLPVDAEGEPLAFSPEFADNPAALAWLWKDHTAHAEAEEITEKAAASRPDYLAKCGGKYSSEWYWSKLLRCHRAAPDVFAAAHTWVEIADWIPAIMTGMTHPDVMRRGICAAGHKAMFHAAWGGYPDAEFLTSLDPALVAVRESLPAEAYCVEDAAGQLSEEWAAKLGLPVGIPVAIGAFDAHLGGIGCGISPNVLVKTLGTSSCDLMVAPLDDDLPDIPGLCGIVPESILPGSYGMEAGQSAFGDVYNWFVNQIQPGGAAVGSHQALTEAAGALKPGESGLLSLDWHNGNRTILTDQRLTGMILGITLHTKPAEMYRALIEATAFGSRVIMERFEEYGVKVERVVNCGGISIKNPMVMQILANIMGRTMEVSQSEQTCALGSAIAGAVVAGAAAGGYDNYADACANMTAIRPKTYAPEPEAQAVYDRIYKLYRRMHDALGTKDAPKESLFSIMKELLTIRDEVR